MELFAAGFATPYTVKSPAAGVLLLNSNEGNSFFLGYYLTVDTYRLDENEEILFTLPTVHGPGAVKIIFYYYFRGEEDGTFSVRYMHTFGMHDFAKMCRV